MCDEGMKSKLKGLDDWEDINRRKEPVDLLVEIRNIAHSTERNTQPMMALAELNKMVLLLFQGVGMSDEEYKITFDACWEAMKTQGGNIGHSPTFIADETLVVADRNGRPNNPNDDDVDEATTVVENRMKAAYFLSGANGRKHGELKQHLANQYATGAGNFYPDNVGETLALMHDYKTVSPYRSPRPQETESEEGLSYYQQEMVEDGSEDTVDDTAVSMYQAKQKTNSKDARKETVKFEEPKEEVKCPECNQPHPLKDCPQLSMEDLQEIEEMLLQVGEMHFQTGDDTGIVLLQEGANPNRSSKLYLDSCSTVSLVNNANFMSNIKTAKKPLKMQTNAGGKVLTKTGNVGSMDQVYYDNTALASVVPLSKLEKMFAKVEYSSDKRGGAFVCHTNDGKEVLFKRDPNTSFPYLDLAEDGSELAVTMLQQEEKTEKVKTIRKNYEGWTLKEVQDAIRARKAQAQAGHPSESTFKYEVSRKSESSLYKSCPVTTTAITNARKIFGPSEPCIKGKQVRTKPKRVEPEFVSIPASIVSANNDVQLVGDVMFVSGIPFLVTMSRRIRFVTVQHVPDRKANALANVMKQVICLYTRAGFNVQTALMDGEFEKLKEKLLDQIVVNTTAKNEHVGEIERQIRSIKDRCRCMEAAMPFDILPNIIIKMMVINAVMLMNAHINKQGVSQIYSPREIVLRRNLDFATHCTGVFGEYVLAYDDNTITNTMQERAISGIYVGSAGNMQGSVKVLSLSSGKIVKRRFIIYHKIANA